MLFLPVCIVGRVTEAIPQGTGTNIGDMTGNGGLAASFDGTNFKAVASCSRGNAAGAASYVGKNYGANYRLKRAELYGANNGGFYNNGTTNNVTLSIYGKATAPANATDGTLLATTTVANANSLLVTLTPTDQDTLFQYLWAVATPTISDVCVFSQIRFFAGV